MEHNDSRFIKITGGKDVHIERNEVKNVDTFLEGNDLENLEIIDNL